MTVQTSPLTTLVGLAMLSLAACGPKATPAQSSQGLASQGFVQELRPVPLASVETPYRANLANPALEGDRMALDLKSLARTQLDYTLTMETGDLASLSEEDHALLLAQLAADPRWRVAEVDGVLVATRRAESPAGWTLGSSSFNHDEYGPWRVLLRFGSWPVEHPWTKSEFVARAAADGKDAKVRAFLPPDAIYEGNVTTALSVEGKGLALDVYEMGPAEDRAHTRWALGEIPSMVHNVRMMRQRIASSGHEPMLLPRGEPAQGGPSLAIREAGPGELEVVGRANPGAPGWTWLRLSRDGAPYEELAVVAGTRERIGWSPDDRHSFALQSRFAVEPGPAFRGRAELWFLPERGEARLLHGETLHVPAR